MTLLENICEIDRTQGGTLAGYISGGDVAALMESTNRDFYKHGDFKASFATLNHYAERAECAINWSEKTRRFYDGTKRL